MICVRRNCLLTNTFFNLTFWTWMDCSLQYWHKRLQTVWGVSVLCINWNGFTLKTCQLIPSWQEETHRDGFRLREKGVGCMQTSSCMTVLFSMGRCMCVQKGTPPPPPPLCCFTLGQVGGQPRYAPFHLCIMFASESLLRFGIYLFPSLTQNLLNEFRVRWFMVFRAATNSIFIIS